MEAPVSQAEADFFNCGQLDCRSDRFDSGLETVKFHYPGGNLPQDKFGRCRRLLKTE